MRQLEEAPGSAAPVLPPSVPPGLPELMEGLSREVLRHNPKDIYAFCARHMENLLKIREELNPIEKPMLKSKTPLALEQKIERTQNLARATSEEHHKHYLKTLSTAIVYLKENSGKVGNGNESENQTLNGYEEVVDENAIFNEDEDVSVASKFTENNEGIVEEKLVDKSEKAKKGNLGQGKEVEDNSVKKDSLVEKKTVDESESNENKSISEECIIGENKVLGNVNKEVLDDEKVSKENDKELLVEVRANLINGKGVKGSESGNNQKSFEKNGDLDENPVQESEQGKSEENPFNSRLDKEISSLEGNENLVNTETTKSFVDKNTTEDNERKFEHKISEISENFIDNIVAEGTKILTKSKPVEESIVEPQKIETVTIVDKGIGEHSISTENESSALPNTLKNIAQESKVSQESENLPGTPTAEEQLSLTKDKESLDKNTGNENFYESETVDGVTLTKINTSLAEETENEKIGDILEVREPIFTIDQHNDDVVNDHIIEKKIMSVEESTPQEIKTEDAEEDKIKDGNENSTNNTIIKVNRKISNEMLTEEKRHLNDSTTTDESKTLDGDDTEKKRSEHVDDKSVNQPKDLPINTIIDGVVKGDETRETETPNTEGKNGNLVPDNSKENKQLDREITAKGSEGFLEYTFDKINGLHSHNEELPNEAQNKVIKTEIVEVIEPFIESLHGSGKLLTHNINTKEDAELETKIAQQIITNGTTDNKAEFDRIQPVKTEKDSKENDVQVMTEEDTNKINVTENTAIESNTTENKVNKINEITIDENIMNHNGVKTISIQMNTDAVHVSTKSDTENSNNTIEKSSILLQNVPGSRKKRSLEEKDEQDLKLEISDLNLNDQGIENNKDGVPIEENEKLENGDGFQSPIKSTESPTDNSENDKNTISVEIKSECGKSMSDNENGTPNEKVTTKTVSNNIEQFKDVAIEINKGKSAPDIVDTKILQNNAELMILSHSDSENNSEDKNTDIKPNIQDMKEQSQDNPNTENHTVSQKCNIEAQSQNRTESTEKIGDEQVHDSSDEKSSLAEEDPKISLHKDDNAILNTSESMDLETAAITMQKAFQAFLFESTASNSEDNDNCSLDIPESTSNTTPESGQLSMDITESLNERRQPGILTRANTVLQTVNEEKSLSLSTDESSGLSSAATVIQAHVRGFLTRNRLSSNKFTSSDTPANSVESTFEDLPRATSAKTVLKINIPEQENFSNGDSIDTSVDLPIDPVHSVVNLHPLGYDKDARKPLKREDAIQSISPPSNSSMKLSEEANSPLGSSVEETTARVGNNVDETNRVIIQNEEKTTTVNDTNDLGNATKTSDESKTSTEYTKKVLTRASSDETDLVTPFKDGDTPRLLHSSEFHDVLLPTQVVRKDSSVVREFKCVLAYFMKWHST